MGGVSITSVAVRFAVLLFLQVFLLRQISLGWNGAEYVFAFVTPALVGSLPLRTPKPVVVLTAFAFGLAIDLFYGTLGLHAAAATWIGYARQFALAFLAPRDGYNEKANPEGREMPRAWWLQYLAILAGLYCLAYFSLEAFTPLFWDQVLLKTVLTTPLTWVFCLIVTFLVQPRL